MRNAKRQPTTTVNYLFLTLVLVLSLADLQGQTIEKTLSYSDSLGNSFIYYLEKKTIPTKFDTIFIKTEITANKLGLTHANNVIVSYDIWSIKRLPFSNWYELTLGAYVTPLDKGIAGSFGGHKLKFKVKKKDKTYTVIKTKDHSGFI